MSCEIFKTALNEAAATNAYPAADLRAHLEKCANCHAEFTAVRTTFAAIDSHLSVLANIQPSSAFLPRVRSLIRRDNTPKFKWTSVWLTAAVGAAVVLAVMIFPFFHHENPLQPQLLRSSEAPENQSSKPIVAQSELPPQETRTVLKRSVPRFDRHKALGNARNNVPREPDVLVPQEERVSFAQFLSAVQRREVAVALANIPARDEQKLLQVDPLQVAKLTIAPLDGRADRIFTNGE